MSEFNYAGSGRCFRIQRSGHDQSLSFSGNSIIGFDGNSVGFLLKHRVQAGGGKLVNSSSGGVTAASSRYFASASFSSS